MTEEKKQRPLGGSRANAFQKATSDAMAQRIESIALELRSVSDPAEGALASNETLSILAATMQSMLKRVDAVFGIEGFTTCPACIIVLELFQAKARGGALSIASLGEALSCPKSVTYRWVDILEAEKLLEKFSGARGGLRVCLTEKGYLKAAEALQLLM